GFMTNLSLGTLLIFFIATGLAHFLRPEPFLRITPPWVPWPRRVNLLAGFWECGWALALLGPPRVRALAAWALIALLAAVFPANVHMLTDKDAGFGVKPLWLWLRLPLQGVLTYWIWILIPR
ncbi:MAG: DoxX family protein, partial [bacterium]